MSEFPMQAPSTQDQQLQQQQQQQLRPAEKQPPVLSSESSTCWSRSSARKSLSFQKENLTPDIDTDSSRHGQVEITIYYPSGKTTRVLENEFDQKICKAIFREQHRQKTIVDLLVKCAPETLMRGACDIVKVESRELSVRNSGSILQNRSLEGFRSFSWDRLHEELQNRAPSLLRVVSSAVSQSVEVSKRQLLHILVATSLLLRGRNQEMSVVAYLITFLLKHGCTTQRDIIRISKLGLCVLPETADKKLKLWEGQFGAEVLDLKAELLSTSSTNQSVVKYQLAGDNWDRNILPSYRTSQTKTLSIHLFQVVVVVDRIIPIGYSGIPAQVPELKCESFIPSMEEQALLKNELTFLIATAVVNNVPAVKQHLSAVYLDHYDHKYSAYAGIKTTQAC